MGKYAFIFILISVSVLFSISGCAVYSSEDFTREVGNGSPEELLKHYFISSLKGDTKSIANIFAPPPDGFMSNCVKESRHVPPGEISNRSEISPLHPVKDRGIMDIPSDTSEHRAMTEFLFLSKVPFERVRIVKTLTYGDEALTEIQINEPSFDDSSKRLLFFFKKTEIGWKIIAIGNVDTLGLPGKDIPYARERVPCSQDSP
jgi:hypothetical protein